jgi:uncharacterized protein YgiM (DUF1202 family)
MRPARPDAGNQSPDSRLDVSISGFRKESIMLKILSLGALATLAALWLLPRAEDAAQSGVVGGTHAELELIASLRELAQVPEGASEARASLRAAAAAVPAAPPVAAEPETPAERMVVTSDALNLRSGPSTDAEVLGRLLEGDSVEVAGREGGWIQVATADGATGWAYSDYLAVATE